jgi:hypothetical protein
MTWRRRRLNARFHTASAHSGRLEAAPLEKEPPIDIKSPSNGSSALASTHIHFRLDAKTKACHFPLPYKDQAWGEAVTAPQNPFDIDDAKVADENLKEFAKILEKIDAPLAAVLSARLTEFSQGTPIKNDDIWNELLTAAEKNP